MGNNNAGKLIPSRRHERCRCCGSDKLELYLYLGEMPLANNLFDSHDEAINAKRYPLNVMLCENCGLSQLSEVVNPSILFSKYAYRSSMSKTYINHCRDMAIEFKRDNRLVCGASNDFIVDIAGNDGTLLEQFRKQIPGIRLLNIDPAENITKICRQKGIDAWTEFMSINTALQCLIDYGKASVITATNVFAHVDNIRDFLLSCKIILQYNGIIVLEFPYLIDYIEDLEYATTYHEHLSYMAITPLKKLCDETSLKIVNVEKKDIHCGTVRVTIAHDYGNLDVNESVNKFIESEDSFGIKRYLVYEYWQEAVSKSIESVRNAIVHERGLKLHKIAAFGASAKGNTLLNSCNLTSKDILYIVDDTPEKQGKYSPGTGIPIVSVDELVKNPPEYLLILAWNFSEEIFKRLSGIYFGKYIIPIPEIEIIDSKIYTDFKQ